MSARAEIAMPMIRAVLGALKRKGVDTDAFLQNLNLDSAALDETQHRVSLSIYDRVQERAMQILQDPALGLHMGEQTLPVTLGVMGHLLMGAPTIATALEVFFRYHRLISDAPPSALMVEGPHAVFVYRYPSSTSICNRIRAEFGMVQIVKIGQTLLGGRMAEMAVRFEHAKPEYIEEYHRIFGTNISFGHHSTQLIFPAEILQCTVPQPDPLVMKLLEDEAKRQLAYLDCEIELAERVESVLFAGLQTGKPCIRDVAAQLGMNERTLRRKLESEGTSYSHLLSGVQLKLAEKWLSSLDLSIEEIAVKLQFSEPSAFYRAFKRWTGKTPAEYRERQL